uniref:Reverse transcriptase RNase H-like domain-containing protein n=1 Tax=Tanacetum cinerariifolium TaxID=118510 RepID=A0A6L2NXP7_TANCI|nr:hypothetical protein [Tanacetum cinerariifolium]
MCPGSTGWSTLATRDGLWESVSHLPILTDSIILILVLSSLAESRVHIGSSGIREPRSTCMVQTKSGHKASREPTTVLKQHRRPPQAKESILSMDNEDDQPSIQDDLVTEVDKLTKKLESVIGWIQAQPSNQPKARETPTKEIYDDVVTNEEDDNTEGAYILKEPEHGSHHPFKVEARIDISTYDGTVDAEKLDSWIDQLETYFTLYGSQQRKEFYPMGYLQDRWTRWHNLRQQRGQTVQEYTMDFRRLVVTLGISINNEEVFTKYVVGLPQQIQTETRLHTTKNISRVSSIAMAIELKNKSSTQKFDESSKGEGFARGQSKKDFKKMGVKQELIEAIVDTGSQKNLISASLVQKLGLTTTTHPSPYSLGWIQKDMDTPYLWERNAVYFRRAQKYQFEKDGQKYLVKRKYHALCNDVGEIPPNRVIEHDIQLVADFTLPNIGIYRNSVLENNEIKRQVKELLKSGVIRPSSSLCGSPIVLDHLKHLRKVFHLLQQQQLRLNRKKCEFGKKQLTYLGFVVGNGELQVDPDKVKRKISEAPVLALPNLQRPSEFETDASGYAMGAVLYQEGSPIAYHSEMFQGAQKNYPTYDKELFALHQVMKHWRCYLLGKETVIHTDHQPLQYLQSQAKLQQGCHMKWITYLQQFNLVIKYKKGSQNKLADMLSRPPVIMLCLSVFMQAHPSSYDEYASEYPSGLDFMNVIKEMECHKPTEFNWKGKLLYKGGLLCVSKTAERVQWMREAHTSKQKYKERHDRHRVEGKFQEGDLVLLHLGKERLKGEYLPSLDELINEQEKVLTEDTIIERKSRSTRRDERKSYRKGTKGQLPSKAKWFSKEVGKARFPHLQF